MQVNVPITLFQNYLLEELMIKLKVVKKLFFFNYHQKQKEPKNKKKIKIKKEEKNRREKLKTNQIENVDLNDDDNSQFSQNDEMSSQFSQIIFNFNKPVEELVQIGDELSAQNDPTSAFRYYKEAANRGYSEAYLKCAEVSLSIEDIILLLENKKVLKKIEESEIDRHQMIEYLNNSRVKKINSS